MYELKVIGRFAAAHNLREFYGKCEDLHGHNWLVEAVVEAPDLDAAGLVLDFGVIKKLLNEALDRLDHKYLNEIEPFKTLNPTSENIARFIYDHLSPAIHAASQGRARVTRVTAWESETASATYIA
jgi:6-pyruvoyltetrahydropterin/6-carboxytetrahydropterin synthase